MMRPLARGPAILAGNALRKRPGASVQYTLAVDEGAAFEIEENVFGERWYCRAQIERNGHAFGWAAGGGERKQDAMNQAAAGAIAIYYGRTPGVDCPSEENAANVIPEAQCINLDHPYVLVDKAFKHVVMEAVSDVQDASFESKYNHDSLCGSIKAAKDIIVALDKRLDQMLATLQARGD